MNVQQYLLQLLFYYDRVEIPSFGKFVSERGSATIHPAENAFKPPRKVLSFQFDTKAQDIFLIEKLSKFNHISVDQAAEEVSSFVREIKIALQEKGAYELKSIGKFYLNIEKILQFTPAETNFLLSSFGLPEFISKPVLHPENIPSYRTHSPKVKKKKRRFLWFRFF